MLPLFLVCHLTILRNNQIFPRRQELGSRMDQKCGPGPAPMPTSNLLVELLRL